MIVEIRRCLENLPQWQPFLNGKEPCIVDGLNLMTAQQARLEEDAWLDTLSTADRADNMEAISQLTEVEDPRLWIARRTPKRLIDLEKADPEQQDQILRGAQLTIVSEWFSKLHRYSTDPDQKGGLERFLANPELPKGLVTSDTPGLFE